MIEKSFITSRPGLPPCADPEGGTGGPDPPEKSQKNRVF